MSQNNAVRLALVAVVALGASACAFGSGSNVPDLGWGMVDGPMCEVRLENGYGTPVELGAIVGGREIALGLVDRGDDQRFEVPCSYQAVTGFRILRRGQRFESRVDQRARALVPGGVTVVVLGRSSVPETG